MRLAHSTAAGIAALALASLLGAQTAPPDVPPPGGGGRGAGARGGGGGDPAQIVDRMMQGDANGDGKLSREEMPERFAERMFDAADANGDGFIDREELAGWAASRRGRGGGAGPAGAPGVPGAGPAEGGGFDRSMSMAGRAMRGLRRSSMDGASRDQDLAALQILQQSLVAAKGAIAEVEPSEAARARYGTDEAGYRAGFRVMLLKASIEALRIEEALLADDAEAAKKALGTLLEIQKQGHDLFQAEEDEAAPAAGGGGRGRGRSGAGTGAGGGAGGASGGGGR